ncbi:MAG: PIN domain-containing protein [Chloroflexota bacterium]
MNPPRLFCDTGVLVRYFTGDDPPRALAAAELIDSDAVLVISTAVLLESIHVLRGDYGLANPIIGQFLIELLMRENVRLTDADQAETVAALQWSLRSSARRIPDAVIAAAAQRAACTQIVTFDEAFGSPSVPVRLL